MVATTAPGLCRPRKVDSEAEGSSFSFASTAAKVTRSGKDSFAAGTALELTGKQLQASSVRLGSDASQLARQFCHFAARGVIILQDIVDCRKNVGEVWARKWHGLHAAKVQRAVRSDQIERRLRETRGLFDARRCHSTSRRDEQSPAARGSKVETIAETQPRQSPGLPGLLRALSRVGRHGDYRDAALVEFV